MARYEIYSNKTLLKLGLKMKELDKKYKVTHIKTTDDRDICGNYVTLLKLDNKK